MQAISRARSPAAFSAVSAGKSRAAGAQHAHTQLEAMRVGEPSGLSPQRRRCRALPRRAALSGSFCVRAGSRDEFGHGSQEFGGAFGELAALALEERDVARDRSVLKRSATLVKPLLAASTYGLSIWSGSPVSTIFVPVPQRVMIVLTSCGVRFCASSTIRYWFGRVRPRMYVSGSTWIVPAASSSS